MSDKPEALRLAKQFSEILSYDPETGLFRWKIDRGLRIKAGDIAGTKDMYGYIKIMSQGKAFRAHRLAWLIFYGEDAKGQIDHINGIRTDNKIANLRCVSNKQNQENIGLRSNNTSGIRGVSFSKKSCRYEAYIRHNGKKINLGLFECAEDAGKAAAAARAQMFTHEARRLT